MLGWSILNRWQRFAAISTSLFFAVMFVLIGGPASQSFIGWLGHLGGIALVIGMLLNPASFGVEPRETGWRRFPLPTRVLMLAGLVAITVRLVAYAIGAV